MKRYIIYYLFFIPCFSFSQYTKIYPTNWWIGMKWNKVQLLVHANDGFVFPIKTPITVSINYPGVKLEKQTRLENNHYMVLDVSIAPETKPGNVPIHFDFPPESLTVDWKLEAKKQIDNGKKYAIGVTSKDLLYLIMPDRFSNGDPSNDKVPGMLDQSLNRDTVFNRHGGDFKGIENHLDYLQSLGVTALWLNPVLENDMPNRTEHGYAFTDHYVIDKRLGGNEGYKKLIAATHAKGMKIIQDAVYNHVGILHWFIKDKPTKDWLHNWPEYTQTSYKDQVIFDPHASNLDKKIMTDGWFTTQMPDLNENNPYVANFLIQHALWCVEEFGIDGWRIDTYGYNDLPFMNRCNQALMDDYPNISIFGETLVHGVANQSYFAQNKIDVPFKSNLPGITDFTLTTSIADVMNKPYNWTDGLSELYTNLSYDFLYKDPTRNVIFLDNHDMSRFYSVVDENTKKLEMGLGWLLTCRGIPEIYYGTEVLMPGTTNPTDGYVRKDFPGGWAGDANNKFEAKGRTEKENEVWSFISKLANYRKQSSALQTGNLMQFVPYDSTYTYFRYDAKSTVMVTMSTSNKEMTIKLNRFAERTKGFTTLKNVLTGETMKIGEAMKIEPWGISIMELK